MPLLRWCGRCWTAAHSRLSGRKGAHRRIRGDLDRDPATASADSMTAPPKKETRSTPPFTLADTVRRVEDCESSQEHINNARQMLSDALRAYAPIQGSDTNHIALWRACEGARNRLDAAVGIELGDNAPYSPEFTEAMKDPANRCPMCESGTGALCSSCQEVD